MTRLWRALRQLLPLLPPSTRWFLVGYAVLSSVLAAVDILALSLLALTLGPMVQDRPVDLPLIGEVGPDRYVWLLGGITLLVVLKGLAALVLQWAVSRRLGAYDLVIGDRLFGAYIRAPWTERLKRTPPSSSAWPTSASPTPRPACCCRPRRSRPSWPPSPRSWSCCSWPSR